MSSDITDIDRQAISTLRSTLSKSHIHIPSVYDTDFNLLRWIKGYENDTKSLLSNFADHLKYRQIYNLNLKDAAEFKFPHFEKYFPFYWLGNTGKDNRFAVIERTGVIDINGLMRSLRPFELLKYKMELNESWLRNFMQHENETGHQASLLVILDLGEIQMDTSLINAVSGPYATLLKHLESNYPEFVSKVILINTPSFMPYIWKLIKPFLNPRTASKIVMLSDPDDWLDEASAMFHPNQLPRVWGGAKRNDPKFDAFLQNQDWQVPESLHANGQSPEFAGKLMVKAGGTSTIVCSTKDTHSKKPKYMLLKCTTDSINTLYGLEIHHSRPKTHSSHLNPQTPESKYETVLPYAEYPTLYRADDMKIPIPGPGLYKITTSNPKSWFSSIEFSYDIQFADENGNTIPCELFV